MEYCCNIISYLSVPCSRRKILLNDFKKKKKVQYVSYLLHKKYVICKYMYLLKPVCQRRYLHIIYFLPLLIHVCMHMYKCRQHRVYECYIWRITFNIVATILHLKTLCKLTWIWFLRLFSVSFIFLYLINFVQLFFLNSYQESQANQVELVFLV